MRAAGAFRGDIEGLRGLAVALVLLGHAGVPQVRGGFVGVDVFFVISGFLITGLLAGELRGTGRLSLTGFYVRRAKRILPAAGVVLVASLLLAYLYLPRIRWSATGWDVLASALYATNWRLAALSTDYLHAGDAPSIVRHFWSLAVEEQFYLVWPLLLLAAVWLGRPLRRQGGPGTDAGPTRVGPRLLAVIAIVGVPSLAWSIHLSQTDPARAYFVTTTRMWELALGGGLAILSGHLARLPRAAAAASGWAGMAAIAIAATAIEPGTAPYPVLLATAGAAAVIAAGVGLDTRRSGPTRLLELRPVRATGTVSYSLYLWHWPLLVVAEARWGPLDPVAGLAVVLASAVPAVLTYRLVENPVRRARLRPARAVRMGLAATGIPLAAALGLQLLVPPPAAPPTGSPPAGSRPKLQGAEVLGAQPRDDPAGAPTDRVESITPDPLHARDDIPDVYRRGCITEAQESSLRTCVYGDPDSTVEVALAGDSHAAHWVPALQAVAEQRHWRLVTYIKTTCPVTKAPVAVYGKPDDSCTQWNRNLLAALTGPRRPRLLVVSSVTPIPLVGGKLPSVGPATSQAQTAALTETWSDVVRSGLRLVVIRDTPAVNLDVPECVSENRYALGTCARPRNVAVAGGLPQERAAAATPGVTLVNLNDAICPTERCAMVIGGVLVYRDGHHLTATYARSLAPRLNEALPADLP